MSIMVQQLLGEEAESLLTYTCHGIPKEKLTLPGPDFIERVFVASDRPINVLRNLQFAFNTGVWPIPVIFPFYLWTKGWSTPLVPLLHPIPIISIRKIS